MNNNRFWMASAAMTLAAIALATMTLGACMPLGTITPAATLMPAFVTTPQAAAAAAQATQAVAQAQMVELQVKSTMASMSMTQAVATQQWFERATQQVYTATAQAVAAAATQQAANERGTATAQAMAATATQQAANERETATAQAQAATATQQAGNERGTATAQAWDATATQQAWAAAMQAQAATATQAAALRSLAAAERRAYWQRMLIPVQAILPMVIWVALLALAVIGCALAYRRLMPVLETRLRAFKRGPHDAPVFVYNTANRIIVLDPDRSFGPALLAGPDGATTTGCAPNPQLQERVTARDQAIDLIRGLPQESEARAEAQRMAARVITPTTQALPDGGGQVEIIEADAAPIGGWLAEVERKLLMEGDDL